MAEIRDLSTTDANNTARFPESQAPSTVNNGARSLEGMLARAFEDTIDGILITGGTGSAYTLSPNRSWTASATMDNGTEFSVRFAAACADSPTLNVDTTDARQLRWPDGSTLSASDILADTQARVKYNSSLSCWIVMDAPIPQKNNLPNVINSRSLTTTITGSAFIPVLSKATGTAHKFLKSNLVGDTTSWTPALTFATAGDLNVAYSLQIGRYWRIGSMVVLTFAIQTSTFTHTTASGNLRITGLPVAAATITNHIVNSTLTWQGITKANYTQISVWLPQDGRSSFEFQASGSGQNLDFIDTGDVPTGGTVILYGRLVYAA